MSTEDAHQIRVMEEWIELARASTHMFKVRQKFWILANKTRRKKQGIDEIHILPRTLQILRMPFGLKYTESTFKHAIYIIRSAVKCKFALV